MHVNELPPIFAACCAGSDNMRYSLSRPFVSERFICATDGRILVRRPVPEDGLQYAEGDALPEGCIVPSLQGLDFSADSYESEPSAYPVNLTEDKSEECDCCHGEGYHECCKEECRDCDGTGHLTIYSASPVGHSHIKNDYLRILIRHGASVHVRKNKGEKTKSLRFFGDGWDGIVMPIR